MLAAKTLRFGRYQTQLTAPQKQAVVITYASQSEGAALSPEDGAVLPILWIGGGSPLNAVWCYGRVKGIGRIKWFNLALLRPSTLGITQH
jgi:hypothetical protein